MSRTSPESLPRVIGLTLGDGAGIGPEIIDAALASSRLDRDFTFRVIGASSPTSCLGTPDDASARMALGALEEAAHLAAAGEIAAVVTGPISKARMRAVGFGYPGQTEFFAARCGVSDYAMLLTGGRLTVALVTTHCPLRNVADALTCHEIVRVGSLLVRYLVCRHAGTPRIAVAGLNPHAGESGLLGAEEIEVIAPAVEELRGRWGRQAEFAGPIPPDTVFHQAVAGEHDAVLCMYHDQGLIPLKLHAFHEGVNVTLGLPYVRTSPDHGTAFSLAGRGLARADSMIAALNLAAELVKKNFGVEGVSRRAGS